MRHQPHQIKTKGLIVPDRNSDTILKRLLALHPKIIDLSLDRMVDILKNLGDPEKRLPPVIHVAGTNGKGSLIAYLRAILEAAGYRVHTYTSPHLVRFAERIVLAGETISEDALSDLLLDCEQINGSVPITYFEITTAAAFKAFADTPADILLLETGLGGRLDATNVVDNPAVVALTPISQDHAQFLGTDVIGIAGEKAGIMKTGAPVVIGPQSKPVKAALAAHAAQKNAIPSFEGDNWRVLSQTDDKWEYEGAHLSGIYSSPALHGPHQTANAATAVAVLEKLDGFTITKDHVETGMISVEWPARMQRLTQGNLINRLPDTVEVWLDGGHNEAAGEKIADCFKGWEAADNLPTYLISGMLNTKDQLSYYRHLQSITQKAVMVPIEGEAAATPAPELAAIGLAAGIDCTAAVSVEEAVDMLIPHLMKQPCRLLISGSLYLAGNILRHNA